MPIARADAQRHDTVRASLKRLGDEEIMGWWLSAIAPLHRASHRTLDVGRTIICALARIEAMTIKPLVTLVVLSLPPSDALAQRPDTPLTTVDHVRALGNSIAGSWPALTRIRRLVHWISDRFEWSAIDCQRRTPVEVIARRGGARSWMQSFTSGRQGMILQHFTAPVHEENFHAKFGRGLQ